MPSRKRSKGQARKANNNAQLLERTFAHAGGDCRDCRHGSRWMLPPSHPCMQFVQTLMGNVSNETCCTDAVEAAGTVQKCLFAAACAIACSAGVVEDDAMRTYVIDGLLAMGAAALLDPARDEDGRAYAAGYAGAIMLIEKCIGEEGRLEMIHATEGDNPRERSIVVNTGGQEYLKMRSVFECNRSLLRFYSKRLPCSCIDEMYAAARGELSKTGYCDGCKQMKKRRHLKVCSVCRCVQYCSRLCQEASWSDHRAYCEPCRSDESSPNQRN